MYSKSLTTSSITDRLRFPSYINEADRMTNYAQLGSKLLRDAATFFRRVGEQNETLKEQMDDNATVYEQVADLLEQDPLGVVPWDPAEPS
jgi:hypothetical protein